MSLTVLCPIDNLQIIFFKAGGENMWENKFAKEGLTFDDVLLIPAQIRNIAEGC